MFNNYKLLPLHGAKLTEPTKNSHDQCLTYTAFALQKFLNTSVVLERSTHCSLYNVRTCQDPHHLRPLTRSHVLSNVNYRVQSDVGIVFDQTATIKQTVAYNTLLQDRQTAI